MAKKRTRARTPGVRIVKVSSPRAAKPIVIRAPSAPRAKKHRRRSSRGGGTGALTVSRLGAIALGGAALGFLEKQFPNLPTIPLIGKKGTIVLAAYYFSKKGGSLGHLARDVAIAGAALAGNELGSTGKISGDVVPQVHGVAAQT
jgi:hypothetical protein